jgi:hypothetical protein
LVESIPRKNSWAKPLNPMSPLSFDEISDLDNFEFVKQCILNVGFCPDLFGGYTHAKCLQHLNDGFYIGKKIRPVKKIDIYQKFIDIFKNKIQWESKRINLFYGEKKI